MASALIALGSNLGDRQRILDDAVAALAVQPNIVVLATSRWHATRPIGGPAEQPEFLNGAVLLGTSLSPQHLHAVLKQVELAAGRTREDRWGPRTLDIDLLLYDRLVVDTPELVVPHPRMSFRRFVLEPAAEIVGWMVHPSIGWTIKQLRDHLPTGACYLAAISGPIAAGKTALANSVVKAVKWRSADSVKWKSDRLVAIKSRFREQDKRPTTFMEHLKLLVRMSFIDQYIGVTRTGVSDYWIEQLLCNAELDLPKDQYEIYAKRYMHQASRVKTPKLLVFLDAQPDVSWQRIAERGEQNPPRLDWLDRYRQLLLQRVAAPGLGPVLRLDGTKADEARDELIAAIQAMM
jgi:2-amino-4-hydroxy-6-hydroxymethyldihydropteridine diphosphokinase